jgi:hypothetical protein
MIEPSNCDCPPLYGLPTLTDACWILHGLSDVFGPKTGVRFSSVLVLKARRIDRWRAGFKWPISDENLAHRLVCSLGPRREGVQFPLGRNRQKIFENAILLKSVQFVEFTI